ncbi:hypothetical protein CEXT_67541 [Caerostris extrusa]|uniref:Uncharacterized protein n=1 Tax=Caerostris extrusa TaxID=172846 RepID=A0AAV4XU50_CAEEX|nr:hypothetical protein CEXT_67541 [Caerostris extrusa]
MFYKLHQYAIYHRVKQPSYITIIQLFKRKKKNRYFKKRNEDRFRFKTLLRATPCQCGSARPPFLKDETELEVHSLPHNAYKQQGKGREPANKRAVRDNMV